MINIPEFLLDESFQIHIFDIINWKVSDVNLDDSSSYGYYTAEKIKPVLLKDKFIETLTEDQIIWAPLPNDPNFIIFIYPIVGGRYDQDNRLPVELVKYSIDELPNSLSVLGAIATYYGSPIYNQVQTIEDPEILDLLAVTLEITIPKSRLLKDKRFENIAMAAPGYYIINFGIYD